MLIKNEHAYMIWCVLGFISISKPWSLDELSSHDHEPTELTVMDQNEQTYNTYNEFYFVVSRRINPLASLKLSKVEKEKKWRVFK